MLPPSSNLDHSLCPILLGASLPLSPHSGGLPPSVSVPELQGRHRHRKWFTEEILEEHEIVCWLSIKKMNILIHWKISVNSIYWPLWYKFSCWPNSKLPMCHHWTWSRKEGTRYFSWACRTSSRDTTEDRPSETLDAALPVDVPKATRTQLSHLSYRAWPMIQGGILPLLPCP